jgi:TPR repeat protein
MHGLYRMIINGSSPPPDASDLCSVRDRWRAALRRDLDADSGMLRAADLHRHYRRLLDLHRHGAAGPASATGVTSGNWPRASASDRVAGPLAIIKGFPMTHSLFRTALAALVLCWATATIPTTATAAMDNHEVFGLLERAKNGDAAAVDELRRNADAGDPVAQTGLATVYLAGLGGVAKDDAEAARLTRLAAEQGFPPAEYDLALLYFTGRGVPKDIGESAKWLEKAANSGIAPAQNNLGLLYAVGQGVPKDLKSSAAWFRKAADQGFAEAQNNLGVLYANGEGVKKDPKEAKKWFEKAAAQGHPGAQRNIEMLQQQQQQQQPQQQKSK